MLRVILLRSVMVYGIVPLYVLGYERLYSPCTVTMKFSITYLLLGHALTTLVITYSPRSLHVQHWSTPNDLI